MPTRLVDLGQAGTAGVVLVVDTPRVGNLEDGRYCCLSHCWGGFQPVKLETKTSQLLRSGLPLQQLPKTFQDAVEVCLWLGVRYLWIDSLCIIQDSKEDWEREAEQMALIYKYGHATLAATDSRDATSGLFRDRYPSSIVAPLSRVIHLDSVAETQVQTACVVDKNLWLQGIELAPLNQRAWVLQVRWTMCPLIME